MARGSAWWRRTARGLWGYDFFLSYQWSSGGPYAVGLAERLRDRRFDCFLDRAEFASGDDWKAEAEIALRNTRRLVVIATRDAIANSAPVHHELEVFTSRNDRVIPIVFGERFTASDRNRYPALLLLPANRLEIVEDPEQLEKGPSERVVDQVIRAHKILRRRSVRAAVVAVAFAVVLLAAIVAFVLWGVAEVSRQKAQEALVDSQRELARNLLDRGAAATQQGDANGLFFLLRAFQTAERLHLPEGHGLSADESTSLSARRLMAGGSLSVGIGLYHENELGQTVLSPDGSIIRVLSVNYDSEPDNVHFWEASTGRLLGVLPVSDEYFNVSMSKDWTAAVIWSGYEFEHLDVLSGRRRSVESELKDRRSYYAPQALSRNGGLLAIASADGEEDPERSGILEIWDVETGDLRHTLAASLQPIDDLALSDDGGLLLVETPGGVGWVDTETGRRLDPEPIEGLRISVVQLSRDGANLAFAGDSGQIEIWATRPACWLLTHESSFEGRIDLEFSPDGSVLLAWSETAFQLYEAKTGSRLGELHRNESFASVMFSPDGRWLATAEGGGATDSPRRRSVTRRVQIWDVPTSSAASEIEVDEDHGTDGDPTLRFSADGELVLVHDESQLRVFERSTGRRLSGPWRIASDRAAFASQGRSIIAVDRSNRVIRVRHFEVPTTPISSREDRLRDAVLSPGGESLAAIIDQKKVQLWAVETGQELGSELDHPTWVEKVLFSPDGHWLFTQDSDDDVRVWSASNGELRQHLKAEDFEDQALSLSADGRLLVAGGDTGRIWTAETAETSGRQTEVPYSSEWSIMAFAADQERLAATGYSDSVQIWDVASNRLIREIDTLSGAVQNLHEPETVERMVFSPAGDVVLTVTSYGAVRLWNAESGELIRELRGQGPRIESAAFSPDGRLLATGQGAVASVWDVSSGHLVRDVLGHGRFRDIESVAFSPDGNHLLTAADDGVLRWTVPNLPDDPERIEAWVAVRSTARLNEDGSVTPIGATEWLEGWSRLQELGGPFDVLAGED